MESSPSNKAEGSFCSGAHRSISRWRERVPGREATLTGLERMEGRWYVLQYNGAELETDNGTKIGKLPDTWNLNIRFLNNPWVKEEILREIKKKNNFELNGIENIIWGTAKEVMRGEFTTLMRPLADSGMGLSFHPRNPIWKGKVNAW